MFDWMTFHALAVELAERPEAASQRSAVSRAYYAVFHAALAHASRCGADLPKLEKHAALWQWFDFSGPSSGRTRLELKIGRNGRRLRNRRNDADYEAGADITRQLAESMQLAQSLLADIAELTSPRQRS